jgi:hypothetical protein
MTARARLDPFDIDLQACVDSAAATLTRRFVFTNRSGSARALAYEDVIAPRLRGDPNSAMVASSAGAGHAAVLVQADAFSPDRWIVQSGTGSSGVTFSADVDTASQIQSRVALDQPLAGGASAGPASVAMALGFDFGLVSSAVPETVTVITSIRNAAPSGVGLGETPPVVGGLRILSRIPFQSSLELELSLRRSGPVSLEVFNLAGRRVRTLRHGSMAAGLARVSWDGTMDSGRPLPSGIYFIQLRTDEGAQRKRVVLVR